MLAGSVLAGNYAHDLVRCSSAILAEMMEWCAMTTLRTLQLRSEELHALEDHSEHIPPCESNSADERMPLYFLCSYQCDLPSRRVYSPFSSVTCLQLLSGSQDLQRIPCSLPGSNMQ
jgi:hypothetical protein